MRSKVVLIISILLVMSMALQTNLTVFAQNTLPSITTAKQNNPSSGNIPGSLHSNMDGLVLDQDPVEYATDSPTPEPPPISETGKYDDRSPNLVYSGTWVQQGISSMYSGTETYSTSTGSSVTMRFKGGSITVFYRMHTFFGEVSVAIDGSEVAVINQNQAWETRNVSWTSGEVDPNAIHTLTLTHISGNFMSMDAVSINDPSQLEPTEPALDDPTPVPVDPTAVPSTQLPTTLPPTGVLATIIPTLTSTSVPPTSITAFAVVPGSYDDRYIHIAYQGSWVMQKITGNYSSTESYSNKLSSTAEMTFSGESVTVVFRGHPYFGKLGVNIDGTDVATIDQYTSSVTYQKKWVSTDLGPGVHTIKLTHLSGTYITIDGIFVGGPPPPTPTATKTETPLPPVGYGTYDDYVNDIVYAGTWFGQPVAGNYAKTEHYSAKIGSSASFTFTGENISVVYRGYPNAFGTMNVAIDGQLVGTINQNTSLQTFQNKWSSGNLASGTHTVTLTHMSGPYISLDALTVSGQSVSTPTAINTTAPTKTNTQTPINTSTPIKTATQTATTTPRLPVGYGTYDERVADFVYGGSWVAQNVSGNYLNTEKYSNLAGSTAQFTFTGEYVTVIYRGYPSAFGDMEVKIDGVLKGTINQSTPAQTFQNKWSSGILTNGTHTITLTHKTGPYVSLDGITVSAPPTPTPTKTNTSTPTKTSVPSITPTPGAVGMYFVDSVAGSDSNSGTSINAPWKSLAAITSRKFNPGTIISFKRGSSYTGTFNIDDSGTASSPIVFTAYGSGASPVFQNPGSNTNKTRAITVNADYIIIENLKVTNTQDAGVYINNGSDYVTVRNMEISNTGIGVTMRGASDKVLNNHIHDLHMVNNTVGGDDDYGANGILVSGTSINGEIAYNRFINCKATSYDYGVDGGTIEYYGTISGYNIHHNYAENNQGFLEIGSGATGLVSNNVIAYNVMYNNARPLGVHLSGGFGVMVEGLRFENNTVVDLQTNNSTIAINFYTAVPTANTLIMRNNIFYLTNYSKVASASTFTHSHNLFFFNGKTTTLGFTLGTGETIADPAFVNLAGKDFMLTSASPAINRGTTSAYSADFNGYAVPSGGITDIGAHEYQQ